MDKIWSVLAMPIGLFLCFTPIVIAWAIASTRGPVDRPEDRPSNTPRV